MLNAITLSEVLQVVMFLMYLLLAVLAWLIKRRVDEIDKKFESGELEFKRLDEHIAAKADSVTVVAAIGRIDALEDRVTRTESDIRHLPDKDKAHDLEKAIGDLRTEVSVLSERMKPIAAIADRVQEAMLEKVRA
jgi:prefoldin subunit 5